MRTLLLTASLLALVGCSSYTEYVDYNNGYTRFDCSQSDREYRLENPQYHCKGQLVTEGEFMGMAR